MYVFLIKDKTLFDKCNKIWEKVSNIIKKDFNSELVYNKRYLKAKKTRQKKDFIVTVHEQYWLIQFIEKMKTIIRKLC